MHDWRRTQQRRQSNYNPVAPDAARINIASYSLQSKSPSATTSTDIGLGTAAVSNSNPTANHSTTTSIYIGFGTAAVSDNNTTTNRSLSTAASLYANSENNYKPNPNNNSSSNNSSDSSPDGCTISSHSSGGSPSSGPTNSTTSSGTRASASSGTGPTPSTSTSTGRPLSKPTGTKWAFGAFLQWQPARRTEKVFCRSTSSIQPICGSQRPRAQTSSPEISQNSDRKSLEDNRSMEQSSDDLWRI